MDNLALEKLINEANLLLVSAENELQKPHREILALAACQNAKLSIFKLLEAYLVKHKIQVTAEDNLLKLFSKCSTYNPEFASINIQDMSCVLGTHCDMEEYCIEPGYVQDCVDMAKRIRALLYQS